MEKRVLLAISLMFVVLVAYDYYVVPRLTGPPPAAVPVAGTGGTPGPAVTPAAPPAGAPPAVTVPVPPAAKALVADTEAHEIVVETDDVRAVFSSAGATLRSWKLKKYLDATGQPFEVVPADLPDALPRPFTIATDGDPALSAVLATALYRPKLGTTSLSLGPSAGTLSFEYQDASGLHATKTFSFQPAGKSYILNVAASIDVSGVSRPVTVRFGPALGLGYKPDGSSAVDTQAVLFRNDTVERIAAGTLQAKPIEEGKFQFAGAEEQYFLSVALPGTEAVRVEYEPISLPVRDDPKTQRKFIAFGIHLPGEANLPFFLGPKEFDALHAVDPKFVYAIDFGFFRPIVVPLLQALKWINRYLGNYGWSIIVLTILINLLIFPLRHKSMVSMRKMQTAQPEIKAIQDRYAKYKMTDPEKGKMQTELVALYKQKGINPASGCVPMLLTFPILLAFYSMLSGAIELRGAPFHFWIHDLALRDPLYITPVLMGATMFWQQKMMPTPAADPLQQKLFLFMPLIFTVSFLWAPAGMVLYWLMSNLMGILQQTVTLRLIGAPPRPAPKARPLKASAPTGQGPFLGGRAPGDGGPPKQ